MTLCWKTDQSEMKGAADASISKAEDASAGCPSTSTLSKCPRPAEYSPNVHDVPF